MKKVSKNLTTNLLMVLIFLFLLFMINIKSIILNYQLSQWVALLSRIFGIFLISVIIGSQCLKYLKLLTKGILRKKENILILFFILIIFTPALKQMDIFDGSHKLVKQFKLYNKKQGNDLSQSINQLPGFFERRFDKNFQLKNLFVNINAIVKIYFLKISPNPNVILGKNQFYFEGYGLRRVEKGIEKEFDNIADYMGQMPFTEGELKTWKRRLEERNCWLNHIGSKYVFVLAPTKGLVYPEYLPTALQKLKAKTRYMQLVEYLKKNSDIHFIDLKDAFLKAKKLRDYPLLFYKSDFHWNYYGAFIAYQSIINEINRFFPEFQLRSLTFEDFNLNIQKGYVFKRFYNMIGLPTFLNKNEHYITFVPRPENILAQVEDIPEKGIYDVYPPVRELTMSDGKKSEFRTVLNPSGNLSSILILGDSFIEKCIYYFAAHSKQTFNLRTVTDFPTHIFNFVKPDVVVQEILNMFILQPPPKNPLWMAEFYLQSKFELPSSRLVSLKEINALESVVLTQEGEIVPLMPGIPDARIKNIGFKLPFFDGSGSEMLVVKIVLNTKNRVSLQLLSRENDSVEQVKAFDVEGKNTWYVEIPIDRDYNNLFICFGKNLDIEKEGPVKSIEIRSIEAYK